MSLRILIGKMILSFVCAYTPQCRCRIEEKDLFFSRLRNNIIVIPVDDLLFICGDLNGHVGKVSGGFEGFHGGHGFSE